MPSQPFAVAAVLALTKELVPGLTALRAVASADLYEDIHEVLMNQINRASILLVENLAPGIHFCDQLLKQICEMIEDKRALAALGYLTLGRRFLNNQPDIIDDRIDVVTRGFMGLTVTCARCHDHKYDPIPTKDYYSLYGVFASSSEPNDKPLLGKGALPAAPPVWLPGTPE